MEQPNMLYINELSGNDEAFKNKLIEIVKEEFPDEKKTYHTNLSKKDFKIASENVHKLKHKISILGLEKSYELATVYENNLLEGNTSLKDEFKTILTTITNYLEKL